MKNDMCKEVGKKSSDAGELPNDLELLNRRGNVFVIIIFSVASLPVNYSLINCGWKELHKKGWKRIETYHTLYSNAYCPRQHNANKKLELVISRDSKQYGHYRRTLCTTYTWSTSGPEAMLVPLHTMNRYCTRKRVIAFTNKFFSKMFSRTLWVIGYRCLLVAHRPPS